MTREMYERAVARMKELGEFREKDSLCDDGRMMRTAVVFARRPIAEGVEMAKTWLDLAAEVGGLVDVFVYRSSVSSEFDDATVEWRINRELSVDEIAAQEVERCAG